MTRRAAAEQDIRDEVEHYFEQAVAAYEASGLSPEEARRTARRELGHITFAREQVRSYGWENVVETLVADLRHGARRLRRSPGFTAVAALNLALGVGVTTALFSVMYPVLVAPLPYPEADRIMMLWDVGSDGSRVEVTFGTYRELVERSRALEELTVMRPWQPTMTGATAPERLDGQRVSAGYLRTLGVSPLLGRDFRLSDDRPGGPRVVILAHGLWRRRFGGDRSIVGREITLDGEGYTVLGVLPSSFENVVAPSAELWSPLQYDASLPVSGREWGHHLRMIGRLRPEVSAVEARRELEAIARAPAPDFPRVPWASLERGLVVTPLQEDLTRGVRPSLLALFGAALLVLAIACVNVVNLLLARGAQRRGELAMRAALGAERWRIVRQLLTESLVLAAVGGVLGMGVAELGVRLLVAITPPELPRTEAIRLDVAAFAFGLVVTALVGLAVALIPALHASRRDLRASTQFTSPRGAGGGRPIHGPLVVVQVALAVVLLVGAGLLLRSLELLFAVSPGFDPSRLLTMQVQTSGPRFEDDGAVERFFSSVLEAVGDVPGVTKVALTSQLPLTGDADIYGVQFESLPSDDRAEDQDAFRYAVSPGYTETMGIPLRRGRRLDAHDLADAPRVALINESFARRTFPGQDPLGRRLHVGRTDVPWLTVVGVVGDVKQTSLAIGREDAVYVSSPQWYFADRARWLVVRTRGDPAALAPAVREAVWSVDRDQPITRVATMEARVAESAAARRFALVLFQTFGFVALALAATGIYGVLAGSVAERVREIGIRLALGASPSRLVALVVRQGMALAALGVVIGLGGALAASRAIASLLYGVSRLDAATHVGVVALMMGVAGVACWIPASRAARVDPAMTLRAE